MHRVARQDFVSLWHLTRVGEFPSVGRVKSGHLSSFKRAAAFTRVILIFERVRPDALPLLLLLLLLLLLQSRLDRLDENVGKIRRCNDAGK